MEQGDRFQEEEALVAQGHSSRPLKASCPHSDFKEKSNFSGKWPRERFLTQLDGESWQQLFDLIPRGIVINLDHKVIFANQWAAQVLGYASAAEFVGRPLKDLVHADCWEGLLKRMNKTLEEGQTFPLLEERFLRADGSVIDVAEALAPIIYENTLGIIITFGDITQYGEMVLEGVKLKQLDSLMAFAGGLAHDFNNLMTIIAGNIALAKMDNGVSPQLLKRLDEMEKACAQAQELTGHLVNFAKGHRLMEKKLTAIGDLIKETVQMTLSAKREIHCQLRIAADLPLVEVDQGQIRQVLNNLLLNAVQAMPQGGEIWVEVNKVRLKETESFSLLMDSEEWVLITVRDQGGGIPKENLDKLFEPYFTTRKQGNGLGLFTSYVIITNHGGQIKVESQEGVGTTFFVYLPVA